ncbi:MAG: hypothetical protein ACLFWL_17190 [Candidatus Brocadiia bacterium]
MEFEEVKQLVREAIEEFWARDPELFTWDTAEWSMAHRLAVYLEQQFPDCWDVDCEYNRQGKDGTSKPNSDGQNIRPDIILHKRGKTQPEDNLLVVELKKEESGDAEKAKDYTKPPHGAREYQYKYGLLLELTDQEKHQERWFRNGKPVDSCEIRT